MQRPYKPAANTALFYKRLAQMPNLKRDCLERGSLFFLAPNQPLFPTLAKLAQAKDQFQTLGFQKANFYILSKI